MILCARRSIGPLSAFAAWVVATELGQILPYADCSRGSSWSLLAAAAAGVVALAGIVVAYGGRRSGDRTRDFLRGLSVGIALIFAFALSLQVLASILLDPCQRY